MFGGADNVLSWLPRLTPGYRKPQHLRSLARAFADASDLGNVRSLFSTAPRFGKTELAISALVRQLVLHPKKTNAFVGYSAELAEAKSRKIRDLAEQAGVAIRQDAKRVGHWQTTDGGGLIAVGYGGPLVGFGIDGVAFCDDLYRNREESESAATRASVESWFTGSLMTRIQGGGSVIVCSTRWSPRDLVGVLIEQGWPYTVVGALDEAGESIWPELWPTDVLLRRMQEVGPYDWASLYMGMPRPKGGAVFEGEPTYYAFEDLDLRHSAIYLACDPAATPHDRADHSVILVGAVRYVEGRPLIDVLDVWRQRVEVPVLVKRLAEMQAQYGGAVLVEAVGAFKAVAQLLRQMDPMLRVVEIKVGGASKFTRSQPAAALWRAGRIRLPRAAPWVPDFCQEVALFTGSGGTEKDDQVDALSHLVNHVGEGGGFWTFGL